MLISEFHFELPEELIAQQPLERRDGSRMLFIERASGKWRDESFQNFPGHFRETDVLVINNTKVFPARLIGEKETGAKIELFLIREIEPGKWEALAKPMKRLKAGDKIHFGKRLAAELLEKTAEGHAVVSFEADGNFEEILDEVGKTPLPPYIKRGMEGDESGTEGAAGGVQGDRERYQTVFARARGAIAAPTAGLHFTPEIIEQLKKKGVKIVEITLHVGYGTFEPVRVEDLSGHQVMPELYEISKDAAAIINTAKTNGYRIMASGTTTTRALESAGQSGVIEAGKRYAELTITPGYRFKIVDGLLTNFHLPKSSLLVLVSTFAGHGLIMNAYRHAVSERYRFYSYGDCMLIV